jgi:hypothetical protein
MSIKCWKELAKDALFVQSASNLSGVAISFAEVVRNVRRNLEASGDIKYEYHKHPIIILWVTQLAHLAGTGMTDADVYAAAYKWVEEKANG